MSPLYEHKVGGVPTIISIKITYCTIFNSRRRKKTRESTMLYKLLHKFVLFFYIRIFNVIYVFIYIIYNDSTILKDIITWAWERDHARVAHNTAQPIIKWKYNCKQCQHSHTLLHLLFKALQTKHKRHLVVLAALHLSVFLAHSHILN